jgi:hypothetical protein
MHQILSVHGSEISLQLHAISTAYSPLAVLGVMYYPLYPPNKIAMFLLRERSSFIFNQRQLTERYDCSYIRIWCKANPNSVQLGLG